MTLPEQRYWEGQLDPKNPENFTDPYRHSGMIDRKNKDLSTPTSVHGGGSVTGGVIGTVVLVYMATFAAGTPLFGIILTVALVSAVATLACYLIS
jgi:hypothetical protein